VLYRTTVLDEFLDSFLPPFPELSAFISRHLVFIHHEERLKGIKLALFFLVMFVYSLLYFGQCSMAYFPSLELFQLSFTEEWLCTALSHVENLSSLGNY